MKKCALICALVMPIAIHARSVFTPVSIEWATFHQLMLDKAFYDHGDPKTCVSDKKPFAIDLWAAGYERGAGCAYSCNGKCTVPLAKIIFGQSSFVLREAFYNGYSSNALNPWVSVSTITPTLEWNEKGAIIGGEWRLKGTFLRKAVRYGVRARLPIKSMNMTRQYTGNDVQGEFASRDAVRRLVTETVSVPGGTVTLNDSFAYRLDFLSSLATNNTYNTPLVDYTQVPLRIGSVDVTKQSIERLNAVQVIYRSDGSRPALPFAKYGQPTTLLASNGSGLNNNQRGSFGASTNYQDLGNSPASQSRVWVVPTVVDRTGGGEYDMSEGGEAIRAGVESALNLADDSIVDYLESKNLNFGSQRLRGLGDFSLQAFVNADWRDGLYFGEFNLGAVLPTGKRVNNVACLLAQPLGNNGHFEVYPGLEVAWKPTGGLLLSSDFAYHFVLKRQENVASAFDGACVKNIGTCVPADISWQWLLFHVQATLFEPHKHGGLTFGYELYDKTCDHVCFKCCSAPDLDGNQHNLSAAVLQQLTHVVANKMQLMFFFTKPYGSIFGGGDYVFAGKNAPQETSWHLGILVEF